VAPVTALQVNDAPVVSAGNTVPSEGETKVGSAMHAMEKVRQAPHDAVPQDVFARTRQS